jgi:hypothetical protein
MNPDRAHDAHIEPADLIEAERAPRRFRTLQDVSDAIVEYQRRVATASIRRRRRVLPPSSSASAEPAR